MTTTELTTLVTGLWAKVKSHVTTAINGLATKSELANYNPIIEDTRLTATNAITGFAPFSTLTNGQRIVLHSTKYYSGAATFTLNLTLPDNSTTGAKNIKYITPTNAWNNCANTGVSGKIQSGVYYQLYFDSDKDAWLMEQDSHLNITGMTQAEVNQGASTQQRTISPLMLRSNFYTESEVNSLLTNYCPIIEDERESQVATIIGTAPFAELEDGQRIIIRFSQITANDSSIQLNLSSGESTGAIPAWVSNYAIANEQRPLRRMAKHDFSGSSCAEFLYNESDNRWVCLTQIDTAPQKMYQGLITAGTSTDGFAISAALLRTNFYLKSEAMAKRTLVTTGSALTTDTYVDLGTTDTIAPTLPASPSRADEFVFTFTCVSASPNITLPQGVALADGFDWSEAGAGVQFQVSIQDNIAAYLVLTPNT